MTAAAECGLSKGWRIDGNSCINSIFQVKVWDFSCLGYSISHIDRILSAYLEHMLILRFQMKLRDSILLGG